jgi:hypothetical protein
VRRILTSAGIATGGPYPQAPAWLFAGLALIVAGFYPSYFAALQEHGAVNHFHALSATAWVLLLMAQAVLAARRRFAWHRPLGQASYAIAPLVAVSGLMVLQVAFGRDDPFHQTFGKALVWESGTALLGFVAAYALAIRHRRNVQLHARWMLATVIFVMPSALARLLGNWVFPEGWPFRANIYGAYGLCQFLVGALIVQDLRRSRPLLPFPVVLLLQAVAELGFVLLIGT